MEGTIAIIGVGRMGEALLNGLLRSGWVEADQVIGTTRREERGQQIATQYGVRMTTDNTEAVTAADVVVLSVKPQSLPAVLDEIGDAFSTEQTVISVAAGITTDALQDAIPGEVPVVRVMSNVCVHVDEAMSVLAAGTHAGDADLEIAEKILSHVGKVIRLPEEHLDAVTALSGSGPAYVALLAESMIDAGILLGIPRDVSTELILQTLLGTAKMLRDTGYHPVELREMVTSPGGTTIAAIRQLEQDRVRAAYLNAIEAAKLRSQELAKQA